MQSLMKEAAIESKKGGERGITARSVRKVTAVRAPSGRRMSCADAWTGYIGQVQGLN